MIAFQKEIIEPLRDQTKMLSQSLTKISEKSVRCYAFFDSRRSSCVFFVRVCN